MATLQAATTSNGAVVIEVHRQTSFGDDGEIDHRVLTSRRDRPEASEFGVDDRPEVRQTDASEQSTVFADTANHRRTLVGDDAQGQFLYEE